MNAPVFVKIDQYNELSDILKKIQEKLESAHKTIEQLEKLKDDEDARIQSWKDVMGEVNTRLADIKESLHQ